MKKIVPIIAGLSLLAVGLVPAMLHDEYKAASAKDYQLVTDEITVASFPDPFQTSSAYYTLTGSATSTTYEARLKHGYKTKPPESQISSYEKYLSYIFGRGNPTIDPSGLVNTQEIGYIRKIEVQFADSNILGSGPLGVYLTDEPYETCVDLYPDDPLVPTYVFNAGDPAIEVKDEDYKYIGFKISSNVEAFVKSIKITWELHPFTDGVSNDNIGEKGLSIAQGQTFKIEATGSGEGDYTDGKFKYTIADPSIATVDENGVITGIGIGHTTIKIQYGTGYVVRDIYVQEPINPIFIEDDYDAVRLDNSTGLHEGDIVMFVHEDESKVMSYVNQDGYVGRVVDCDVDGDNHTLSNYDGAEYFYVLGNETDGFRFVSITGEVISFEDDDNWTGLADGFEADTWDVTIDENGVATIVNRDNPEIQLTYDTEYHCYDAMSPDGDVSIYKVNLMNDTVDHESPAVTFAHKFLDELGEICDTMGVNTDLDALLDKWNELFSDATEEYKALNFVSYEMFENADAIVDGDVIERAMYLYELIMSKYEEKFSEYNYLNRDIPASSNNITNKITTDDAVVCVVILSSLLILTGAAYVFRKKKTITK